MASFFDGNHKLKQMAAQLRIKQLTFVFTTGPDIITLIYCSLALLSTNTKPEDSKIIWKGKLLGGRGTNSGQILDDFIGKVELIY